MSDREKIKIYVSKEIRSEIENDALFFEIYKKDKHTVNRNRFLSLLISNYYDSYREEKSRNFNDILSILENFSIKKSERNEIADKVLKVLLKDPPENIKENRKVALPYKPTNDTESTIQMIENDKSDDTVSQYIYRMITCYFSKAMWERERIIFKDNYEYIQRSIDNKNSIAFSLIWDKKIHTVIPYQIAVGEYGLHNYLICAERNEKNNEIEVRSYRLSRINRPKVGNNIGILSPEIEALCKKTVETSPEYAIDREENICVKLTDHGQRLYSRIYLNRPKYYDIKEKENGHYYYFKCSSMQVFNYFRKFENDAAIIMSPDELRNKMIDFHQKTYKCYENAEKNE